MKIVCISDTHGQKVKNLPKADLLIHSGDWSGSGSFKETLDFLNWMNSIRQDYKAIVCVPGNHDRWVEDNQFQAADEFHNIDVDLLIDKNIIFQSQLIHGMPWTPEFGGWAFMGNDILRESYCSLIPSNTSILITHGAPKGHLDELAANSSEPGAHAGCQHLKAVIDSLQPSLHVFGHLHEGSGIEVVGKSLLVNASSMDEYYRLVNGFKVVYL